MVFCEECHGSLEQTVKQKLYDHDHHFVWQIQIWDSAYESSFYNDFQKLNWKPTILSIPFVCQKKLLNSVFSVFLFRHFTAICKAASIFNGAQSFSLMCGYKQEIWIPKVCEVVKRVWINDTTCPCKSSIVSDALSSVSGFRVPE